MSSHHIVRDNQEPALLILDANATPFALIQELLEWSPTVLVSSSTVDLVLSWGIKIDGVLVNEESEVLREKLAHQHPLQFLSCKAGNELITALTHLKEHHFKAVSILAQEQAWPMLESFSSDISITLFVANTRWVFIRNGCLEKRTPVGTRYAIKINNIVTPGVSENGMIIENRGQPFWLSESLNES
jgi:thiamine pyrophosphokinase